MWTFPNLKHGAWRGRNKETRCLLNNYRENWSIEQTRKLVESQSWKKILAKQPTHFSSLSASHGCSLLDRKKHLWTRARGPSGGPGRERCYLGIFLNTTLQAAVNLGGDYEVNLRFVKNHLWNSVEQLFNETGASSPTRCFVWWKMGDDPIATWKSKIKLYSGKQPLQGYESNRWYEKGVRVGNIPRNHNVGPPREDSKSDERPTVWSWAVQRQDHLHVNVQRHCMGRKRKHRKGVNTIQKHLWIMLADSLAVVGLSWSLDQKRNGAEPTPTNPTDLGTEWQRIWWWISQIPVIQYFVPPVPLRGWCFAMVTQRLEISLAKGGGAKKRFQHCVNPNSSNQFQYLRAIQGHQEGNAIDPELQDNVLFPEGLTEYTYHVGNASELNSIIRNGLLPGGRSLKRGSQAVFFTTVNPMEDVYGMGETPCDLTKPRIAPLMNTWKRFQNTVYWCSLKLAQEKGLQFFLTCAVACSRPLQHTTCSLHWESGMYEDTGWALPKGSLSPTVPRVVLKSSSQYGQQDPQSQDARSSWEPSNDSKSFRETWNNTVGLQNIWSTSFCSRAASHNTSEHGQEVDR